MLIATSAAATIATAAKQLADLVGLLNDSVRDRTLRDLVLPVKEKALEVQQAVLEVQKTILEMQREQLRIENAHAIEIAAVNAKYQELESQLSQLRRTTLETHFGLLWDAKQNPHCPACKTPLTSHTDTHFAKCMKCKSDFEFPGSKTLLETQSMIRT